MNHSPKPWEYRYSLIGEYWIYDKNNKKIAEIKFCKGSHKSFADSIEFKRLLERKDIIK